MEHLSGFAPLANLFDGFIVDLWGVVHDGVRAYPGAVDCLDRLRRGGKRVILLSNAPRRTGPAQASMRGMGIPDDLYTGILTSGEAVHRALREPPDAWWRELGPRVFHLGPDRDRNVLDGLPFRYASAPAVADFVLNTGPDDHRNPTDMAEFEPILRDCARAGLKMICANPDLEVIRDGVKVLCAGALAARYQELGGDVRSMGKPDPAIYEPVVAELGLPRSAILAVGDSLRTDIAGAKAAAIESCWVVGGLHGNEFRFERTAIDDAAAQAGLAPRACVRTFRWSAEID